MKKFKKDNVIKLTDSEHKAKKYLDEGYKEVLEKPEKKTGKSTKEGK